MFLVRIEENSGRIGSLSAFCEMSVITVFPLKTGDLMFVGFDSQNTFYYFPHYPNWNEWRLFHCHALGEVARFIYIASSRNGNMIGEQLLWHDSDQRKQGRRHFRNSNNFVSDSF